MLQESLVYRLVYRIFTYFGELWPESFMGRTFKKLGSFFRILFSGSAVVGFLRREGVVNRTYDSSVLYKLVDGLLNLPQRILHPLYKKAEDAFHESVLFKVVLFILARLHLLLAGFLFVALIVPDASWNNRYSTIAMTGLLLLYFLRTVVEGKTGFHTSVFNVFLVMFAVCIVLAQVFSILPGNSLRFLAFHLTCFMLVLLLIVTIRSKKDMTGVLAILLAGMSAAGLYGVYQQIIKVPVNPAWVDTAVNQGNMTRVYSFFNNPNDFAEILLMLLPFYFAGLFNTDKVFKKLIYLALALPPLLSFVFTQTRTAWIALPIAGLVYVFFKEKRLIPVFVLLGIASVPFLPQSILLRLRTITNFADSSLQTRLKIWRTVLPILKDYWFTGLGLGNETLLRVSKNYFIFVDKGAIPSHSHNLYLQLWIETGFPGIITFFAFVGSIIKKSVKALYEPFKDAYTNNILIAGLASLIGILAMGMAEYVWFYPRVMLFFWVIIGIMLAALNIRAQEGSRAMKAEDGRNIHNVQDAAEQDVA